MPWRNIIFTFFSYLSLLKSMGT